MKAGTISVYNEGVTWLVGLSAAAVGGAFLHYETLASAPWYARVIFLAVTLCFLATVYFGVNYAFWLYRVFNQREREEELLDRARSQPALFTPPEHDKLRQVGKEIQDAENEIKGYHNALLRSFAFGLGGAAIILCMAVFTAKAANPNPPQGTPKTDCCQVTVRFSDQMERAVLDRLNNPGAGGSSPVSPNNAVKLDPELEAALRAHLQGPAPSNSRAPWIILIIIGIVAATGLIAWALSNKPEASPLTVAVSIFGAVTAFVVKLSAQKPTLPLGHLPFWVIVASLASVGAAIALIGTALVRLRGQGNHPHPPAPVPGPIYAPEEEREEKNRQGLLSISLLVYGFSAVLLALVPALLFNSEAVHPEKKDCPQCPVTSAMPAGQISVFPLSGINKLGDGGKATDSKINPTRIQNLVKEAVDLHGARAGDILLLLGSADCIPTTLGGLWKNNEELEKARANWVKNALEGQPELSGLSRQTSTLPEYSGCRKSPDVRAVYPFLIHARQNQPGTSQQP